MGMGTDTGTGCGCGMGVGVFTAAMGGVREAACDSTALMLLPVYMGGAIALLMLAGAVAVAAVALHATAERPASDAAITSIAVHTPDSAASTGAEVTMGAGVY